MGQELCLDLPVGSSTPWPRPSVAFLNLTSVLQECSSVCWSTPGERGKRAPPWSGGKSLLPGDLPPQSQLTCPELPAQGLMCPGGKVPTRFLLLSFRERNLVPMSQNPVLFQYNKMNLWSWRQ